ncbi:hypothetical protein [Rufibacter sp. XAAS-G3-1]|uniref:hypothetical protein n=1 Tax=Rufibacter sp. XAAS-G3-1 TaxID=2729134 RepID=UPI0015E737B5|nr:hypothetical protein [Rufibacter sp. XAAS-G3-1]
MWKILVYRNGFCAKFAQIHLRHIIYGILKNLLPPWVKTVQIFMNMPFKGTPRRKIGISRSGRMPLKAGADPWVYEKA